MQVSSTRICGSIASLFALALGCMAVARTAQAEGDIIASLKEKQASITSVSASFVQEKSTRLLTKPVRSSGQFRYRKPGMIRWEYTGNANMQVIYNGRELWIHYPGLKEADRLTGVSQYGSLLQFDVHSLSKDYTVIARKEDGSIYLVFTPKAKGPISRIEMEIPEHASFPRVVRLLDQRVEPTTITFSNVRLNTPLKESDFTFRPGPDITVRERTLP